LYGKNQYLRKSYLPQSATFALIYIMGPGTICKIIYMSLEGGENDRIPSQTPTYVVWRTEQ
jgi:hypothetical protein